MSISDKTRLSIEAGDLEHLEKILYTPRKQELTARKVCGIMPGISADASTLSYRVLKGSGKVAMTRNFSANDIPEVDDGEGYEVTQRVFNLLTKVTIDQDSLMKIRQLRKNKGLSYNLETFKMDIARRVLLEKENDLFYNGDTPNDVKGLLNTTGIKTEAVADSKTASSNKKLWSSKTSQEILEDIRKGIKHVSKGGIYNPDTIILPSDAFGELMKPFGDNTPLTILNWIASNSIKGKTLRIIESQELAKENNVLSKNCFAIVESSAFVMQLGLARDFYVTEPVRDIMGNYAMACIVRHGGLVLRSPAAVYVGTDI